MHPKFRQLVRNHSEWYERGKTGEGRFNLSDVPLTGADLSEADLRDADMQGDQLIGANFRGSDLGGADLYRSDLSGADLTDANLTSACLLESTMPCVNLTGALLPQIFYLTDYHPGDVHTIDLRGAIFWYPLAFGAVS